MYQNIFYDRKRNKIHLWDDVHGYHNFDYKRYGYMRDDDGDQVTMFGDRVQYIDSWSEDLESSGLLYEYDVRPEMRTLIDIYHSSDEISTNHCITILDIEVAKEEQHSLPQDADNTITAISIYDTNTKQFTCLILDIKRRLSSHQFDDIEVIPCQSEKQLLMRFLKIWNLIPTTIASGWNVIGYDFQYLFNRINKVLGDYSANALSPIKKVQYYTDFKGDIVFKIAGISILDYLSLYKLFTYKELPNYTLDAVSRYELGRGKVEYDKDLDHLYETDPVRFIEYNVEDVRLVLDLDKKLDFIAIAQGTCHKGHVPYEDVYYTSRYMEGACLTETKKRGIVATKSSQEGGRMAKGAFVKLPKPGRYQWVYDLDLTSLYPSNIMSLNISPETKWGKILNWDSNEYVEDVEKVYRISVLRENDFLGGVEFELKSTEIKQYMRDHNLCVSANGILYDYETPGLIPGLLDTWFSERKSFRKIADEAHAGGDMETYQYYNRKQHIQKIMLNSLYGVLLLPSFRFYDMDNGEAVTLTGQQVIQFTTKMANYIYNSELGTDGIDYCLYTDTDSVFYEALPLVSHKYPNHTEDEIPDLSIEIATYIQDFINDAYNVYALEFHNIGQHRWNIKQELIARRAFWGAAKKRYAMAIVRDGSKVVDTADIKGFDSVRSNFPKLFRRFLEAVIIDILHDATPNELNDKIIQFKNDLWEYDIMDIMNPTSVKKIDKYIVQGQQRYKSGTPIHVKSVINYNILMDALNIKSAPKIASGDKILWAYLSDNPYMFDTIALRGYDDPPEIIEFVKKYINRDKLFDRGMENKLQSIWDDLGWGIVLMNKNIAKVFSFD